jgi:hypothetical protein
MSAARRAKPARRGDAPDPKAGSPQPVAQALGSCEPLARLALRLRDSNERFRAIENELPQALRHHVQPGPIDDAGWSLLVSSGAVAAKLRQLLPRIEKTLTDHGWVATPIRVRVRSS